MKIFISKFANGVTYMQNDSNRYNTEITHQHATFFNE